MEIRMDRRYIISGTLLSYLLFEDDPKDRADAIDRAGGLKEAFELQTHELEQLYAGGVTDELKAKIKAEYDRRKEAS